MESVYRQDYQHIDHLIIDGASTDHTIAEINSIPNRVANIVSEKDKGIYNAMNKGLQLADGEIIGILNSDDFYNSEDVISKVVAAFETTNADCVFGDLYYVNQEDTTKIVRKWVTGPYTKNAFRKGWHPAHPSFFVKKEIYERFGYFDEELQLAADFELMLRFLEKHRIAWSYIEKPLVRMRLGGATSNGITNMIEGNKECIKAFKKNKIPINPLYTVRRLVPKLKQFF
ncbi:Glycosyl transferase family 2 [Croceitalea dokdonensis DOKDO 023]|uniref:Glycosyl transferase family 2 n=1 Tax=Croceitalea dokdonensis DOKDO 023 TaxID=1300341 RepID=A0A0P7A1S2_9FLAO|nr:Glycosyl transferase family 2 [Croceitalea dokdonensis DOKDO 023]